MTFIALDCLECKSICRVFARETIRRLIANFELAATAEMADRVFFAHLNLAPAPRRKLEP
jgi:hypothetical protein